MNTNNNFGFGGETNAFTSPNNQNKYQYSADPPQYSPSYQQDGYQNAQSQYTQSVAQNYNQNVQPQYTQNVAQNYNQNAQSQYTQSVAQNYNQNVQPQYAQSVAQNFNQNAQSVAQNYNQNVQPQYTQSVAQNYNQNVQPQYTQSVAQNYNQNVQPQYTQSVAQNYNQNAQPQYGYNYPNNYQYRQPTYQPYYPPIQPVFHIPTEEEKLSAQKSAEKKLVRKLGNRTGWAVFAMSMGMTIIFLILLFMLSAPIITADDTDSAILESLINSIAAMISMFGGGFLLLKLTNTKLRDSLSFKSAEGFKHSTALFLLGLGIIPIANLLGDLVSQSLSFIGIDPYLLYGQTGDTEITVLYVVVSIICTAIVPPISEEFFFRGVILNVLKPYGQGFAIVMSSVLFGLVHGNLIQTPFAFIGGLFFAYITIRSKSLLPSMILHGVNNLLSVFMDFAFSTFNEDIQTALMVGYFFIFIIIAFVAFLILAKRDKNLIRFERPESKITEKQKASAFFCNPGMIVLFAIIGLEIFAPYIMLGFTNILTSIS